MENDSDGTERNFANVTIIFEDDNMLAIAKPAGLVVHADGRTKEPTLSDWVLEKYPNLKDVGGMHTLDSGRYAPRAGILHRLDRDTSGVILIAKNDEMFYFLQRQFLDHTIEKTYNAFVVGTPMPNEGVIDASIGRSRSDFRKWTTGKDARGTLRSAVTEYHVIRSSGEFSFLELRPKTGRTHQLRVHLSQFGHPILHDTRYGNATGLGFTRLALHATRLAVTMSNGKRKVFEATLPPDFARALTLFDSK